VASKKVLASYIYKALFGGDFQVVFVKDDSNQASSLMDLISSAKDAGVKLNLK
jgi:hypothetical protein